MIGLMSLWTETPGFRMGRSRAMLFSACAAYLNRAMQDTELVTDLAGMQLADALGWKFTSYSIALENFCPPHLKHVWMLGKIRAQQVQTKPHVHIDLDLALFHALPNRVVSSRVFAQSKDSPHYYASMHVSEYMRTCGIKYDTVPFNTAVIGWNDTGLCNEYCEEVWHRAHAHAQKHHSATVISCVLEQALLADMMREKRIHVETCLGIPTRVLPGNEQRTIEIQPHDDVRFTHFWGRSKNMEDWMTEFERRFRNDFPERYAVFDRGYAQLVEMRLVDNSPAPVLPQHRPNGNGAHALLAQPKVSTVKPQKSHLRNLRRYIFGK